MSTSPAGPLQAAVYQTAIADAGVGALLGGVGEGRCKIYDAVQVDPNGRLTGPFPYCTLGDDQIVPHTNSCFTVWDCYVTLEVWSRGEGRLEAKAIVAALIAALDVALVIAGFRVTAHEVESERYPPYEDGMTRHGVVVIKYLVALGAYPSA